MTLLEASLHQPWMVINIESKVAARLAAMGIVIGVHLLVRQRKPAVIIEYSETLLAMDAEVATLVHVEKTVDESKDT